MEKNNKELKISAENAMKAYNTTDADGKELLELLFGKDVFAPKNIMDRVKTFEDAVDVLGVENKLVTLYESFMKDIPEKDDFDKDVAAYLKLRIVVAALNGGWLPLYDDNEAKYYLYFKLCGKYNYDNDADGKTVAVTGIYGNTVYAQLQVALADGYSCASNMLCFNDREVAEYCASQFIDLWEKYML